MGTCCCVMEFRYACPPRTLQCKAVKRIDAVRIAVFHIVDVPSLSALIASWRREGEAAGTRAALGAVFYAAPFVLVLCSICMVCF